MQLISSLRQSSQSYFRGLGVLLLASAPVVAQASWPVATPDSIQANNTESITIPVLQNDIGDGLKIIDINTTTQGLGVASINADKTSVTYQSAEGYEGEDAFWYAFTDSEGRTNAAKVTITVIAGVSRPIEWPTSVNDSAETTANTSINIDVLSNDSGVGLTLSSINTTSVKLGSAKINPDGKTISYTPPNGFTGADEFWYVFSDSWGRTNAGKITLEIKAQEPEPYTGWPVAEADSVETLNTATVVIPVLANDRGQNLSLVEVNTTTVALGSAKIEGDKIRYAPPVGYTGEDSFWYSFTDDQGRTNSTKVTVAVEANTENSTVAFCGANYSTDGTKNGTFITGAEIDPETSISNIYRSRPFDDVVTSDGNFAVFDDRRYYLETTPSTISGVNYTLWMDDGVTSKIIETNDSDLRITGIKTIDDTLFYETVVYNQPETAQFHSHNGVTKHTIPLPSPTAIYSVARTPYFSLTGLAGDFGSGTHLVKINDAGDGFIKIATGETMVSAFYNVFSHNGLDYASTATLGGGSFGVAPVKHNLSQTDYYTTPETVLNQFSAKVENAVLSNDRLLIVTQAHVDYVDESVQQESSTQFPAKLFTVNTKNEFVELASCIVD